MSTEINAGGNSGRCLAAFIDPSNVYRRIALFAYEDNLKYQIAALIAKQSSRKYFKLSDSYINLATQPITSILEPKKRELFFAFGRNQALTSENNYIGHFKSLWESSGENIEYV